MRMNDDYLSCRTATTLEAQIHRMNLLLDTVICLYPETSERFVHDEEILAVIFAARELGQNIQEQLLKQNDIKESVIIYSLGREK